MSVRIAAICQAQPGIDCMDYLESSLRSVQHAVELVLVGGVNPADEREFREIISRVPGLAAKIEIVQGDLARVAAGKGIPYALLLDAQDVYRGEELCRILSFVEEHPEAGRFQIKVHAYWKSPRYRVDPLDAVARTVIFRTEPGCHKLPVLTIPEDVGTCHNFTFASHTAAVVRRLERLGVAASRAAEWKRDVWDAWNSSRCLRNLHPEMPSRFRVAQRVQPSILPESLAHHPHIDQEIVGEKQARQPVCSIVFVEKENCRRPILDFVRKLAATAPDDCEIVGCASDADTLATLASTPGIKAVPVPRAAALFDAWLAGGEAAASSNLVFLTSDVDFEGDWIEGFIEAFEGNCASRVFLPRFHGTLDKLVFEKFRGRFYGRQSIVDADFNPNTAWCWACTRETLQCLISLRERDGREQELPSSAEEGWLRGVIKSCEATLARADEVVLAKRSDSLTSTTPPAPSKVASRHFLDVAVAPPLLRRGVCREHPDFPFCPQILTATLEDTVVFHPEGSLREPDIPEPAAAAPVTIVIPAFNNLHLTKNCLESVFAHTTAGTYDLVVVDNGSTDGSWDYLQRLQSEHPRLRGIRNRRNLFFARGCNRGAWSATSSYIVFLNNDTIVKPHWLDELLRPLDRDATIGIAGNKQLFPDSHPSCANRVWHAGMVIGADKFPWHICYGFDSDHPTISKQRDCQSVSGCCMAIRRELFEQLGGFDPHFQNGFEDVDLCLRAGELGYRIVYTPHSEIVHLVSRSESRFDREASNMEKFKARWSNRIRPDETEFLRDAGLLPEARTSPARVGFISPFNQKGPLSRYAERLLEKYPDGACIVFSEFRAREPRRRQDPDYVIRCWDREEPWCYPVLRWATTMDLDVIHINFDASIFPPGFLELFQALKQAGKGMVFTLHTMQDHTPLVAGIVSMADAVIVHSASLRSRLIQHGFPARTIRVLPPLDAGLHWSLYNELVTQASEPRVRIRWEGPQLVNHSLALVNREMEAALLHREEVELTITPVGRDTFAASLHPGMRMLPSHYGRTSSGAIDVHVRHQWPPCWDPPAEGRWVVIQPWEYGAVPEDWVTQINRHVDEVWAPSTFVRNLYVESGADPERVHVVPNGVDAEFFKPGGKPYPLKTSRSFKFLFLGGTIHRKGIDLLLEAYRRSFKAADDVTLVIKDMGVTDIYRGQGMGERIREMQSSPESPHITYLDRDLSDIEMVQLYNACDCLVHPYRGEGFALPVLEAMACARPVIVTAGGATDDFVDDSTGYRIPARRVIFGSRSIGGLKTAGDLWLLEPDVDALCAAMVRVFKDRDSARETGRRARARVESGWTWMHAADKALRRVEWLKSLPPLRNARRVDAAVLIDLQDEAALAPVVESLKSTSYASLALFALKGIKHEHQGVEILDAGDFGDALSHILSRVRAPYLIVVTEPLRFSKHWLSQLAGIARVTGQGSRIIVPCVDDTLDERDDHEFQKFARTRWRQHRGAYRQLDTVSAGCALFNWECLPRNSGASIKDAQDWISQLRKSGSRIYLAEDTCVGSFSVGAVYDRANI